MNVIGKLLDKMQENNQREWDSFNRMSERNIEKHKSEHNKNQPSLSDAVKEYTSYVDNLNKEMSETKNEMESLKNTLNGVINQDIGSIQNGLVLNTDSKDDIMNRIDTLNGRMNDLVNEQQQAAMNMIMRTVEEFDSLRFRSYPQMMQDYANGVGIRFEETIIKFNNVTFGINDAIISTLKKWNENSVVVLDTIKDSITRGINRLREGIGKYFGGNEQNITDTLIKVNEARNDLSYGITNTITKAEAGLLRGALDSRDAGDKLHDLGNAFEETNEKNNIEQVAEETLDEVTLE